MKYIAVIAVLLVGVSATACAQGASLGPFASDLTINELASLPAGLVVVHTPESLTDMAAGPTGPRWPHVTTVSSTVGPVRIVEFGTLIQDGGQWRYATVTKAPYTAANFAEWYDCPNAQLMPGESYRDVSNFSVGAIPPGQSIRWYFIGVDSTGNRVKGEADIYVAETSSRWPIVLPCLF